MKKLLLFKGKYYYVLAFSLFLFLNCGKTKNEFITSTTVIYPKVETIKPPKDYGRVQFSKNITIDQYFGYMDSIVAKYDSVTPYTLTEHLLVKANSWVLDTLKHTDYYFMKQRDSFVYNQKKMIALPKNNTLIIPDSILAASLKDKMDNTVLDVNIPEFKLRIIENGVVKHAISVRTGQYRKRYLEMSGRVNDLRTKTGEGTIVRHAKNPDFYNPVNGKRFTHTNRDDKKRTVMPQIPWIETEINGLRHGQMIHPTTNPKSLGKAYSNGCIGTGEADAWEIYYNAPLGTKIKIRYDLEVPNEKGDSIIILKDVYHLKKRTSV